MGIELWAWYCDCLESMLSLFCIVFKGGFNVLTEICSHHTNLSAFTVTRIWSASQFVLPDRERAYLNAMNTLCSTSAALGDKLSQDSVTCSHWCLGPMPAGVKQLLYAATATSQHHWHVVVNKFAQHVVRPTGKTTLSLTAHYIILLQHSRSHYLSGSRF